MAPKLTFERSEPKQRYEAPELVAIETSTTEFEPGVASDGLISTPS